MHKPLIRQRTRAFHLQGGCCCYCRLPMWSACSTEYRIRYGFKAKQAARFQCTGEHLIARKDGGGNACSNIAAACRFCNLQRHRRKTALSDEKYGEFVQKRLAKRNWHPDWMVQRLCQDAGSSQLTHAQLTRA